MQHPDFPVALSQILVNTVPPNTSGTGPADYATAVISNPGAATSTSGLATIFDSGEIAAAAATVDVTGIPATYSNLLIVALVRGTRNNPVTSFCVAMNGDGGGNYQVRSGAHDELNFDTGDSDFGNADVVVDLGRMTALTAPASVFSPFFVLIPSYRSTAQWKFVLTLSAFERNDTANTGVAGGTGLAQAFGWWKSTAAISSMSFTAGTGNIAAGSRVMVYGLP